MRSWRESLTVVEHDTLARCRRVQKMVDNREIRNPPDYIRTILKLEELLDFYEAQFKTFQQAQGV